MTERQLPTEEVLTILAATPSRLATLTADLTPDQLRAAPAPDEWSATEVLAHLRSCADVWGGCIQRILAEDEPTLRALNPRTWIKRTNYPALEFDASLQAFAAQRAELLAMLNSLEPGAWSRSATVTGSGKPLTRTVHSYTQWLARHERPHVMQIATVVATLRS